MWKVITSSNLISQLKLYFYSPILININILLKIYCENIVIIFLNCIFPLFLSTRPYVSFFTFSFLLIFLHHTRIPLSPPSPFFSLLSSFHFIPEPVSLFLSPSLFLYLFFFSYLIPNGERGWKRKNRWVRWIRSAAPSLRSLCRRCSSSSQCSPDGR